MENFQYYYSFVYFTMCLFCCYLLIERVVKNKGHEKANGIGVIFFSALFVVLFGFRDVEVGTDTETYLYTFNNIHWAESSLLKDFGFYLFQITIRSITENFQILLIGMAILYMVPLCLVFSKIETKDRFVLFFVFISFFFFKSLGINILRQGVATSLFLLGVIHFNSGRKITSLLIFLFAFSFHASILIPIACYLASTRINSIRVPLYIFLASIALSFSGFDLNSVVSDIPFLKNFFAERVENYLVNGNELDYRTGFRLDFLLFNTAFAAIAWYYYRQTSTKQLMPNFHNYFCSYLLTSSYFFMMFRVPFSDRYGVLSWIFLPLILMPFLNDSKQVKLGGAVKLVILSLVIYMVF